MTRVANLSRHEVLLSQFQRIQNNAFKTERQISTGKVADQFKDLAKDTGVLLSARSLKIRTGQYVDSGTMMLGRMEIQNVQLETLSDAGGNLRQAVLSALANDSATGLIDEIKTIFETGLNVLNGKLDGKYLYGGTRTDTPPVNVSTLSDLIAAPAIADIFENNDIKQSNRIDDTTIVEYGVLADEVSSDFFSAIKRIAEFDANPATGPFGEPLTAAQRSFLETELANLGPIADDLTGALATNARRYNQVEDIMQRHESTEIYVEGFIADIEEVDLAEAVSRLNQDQVATQASMQMIANLSQLSLLNFL